MFVLSLPLLREAYSKTMTEYFSDAFEGHAFYVGVAEHDEYPAEETDAAVEAECATRGHTLHHIQECGCNDDVGAPACDSVQLWKKWSAYVSYHRQVKSSRSLHPVIHRTYHRAKCSDFHGDELRSNPSNSRNA